jgi:hypothetical protein
MGGSGGGGSGSGGSADGAVQELARRLLCGSGRTPGALTDAGARRIVADAGLRLPSHAHGHVHSHLHQTRPLGGALGCLRDAAHTAYALLDGPMLLGHLLAALALGWLLRRGDVALGQLVRLSARGARTALAQVRELRAALAVLHAPPVGDRTPVSAGQPWRHRRRSAEDERPTRTVLLDHSVRRRGPPAGAGNRRPAHLSRSSCMLAA